MNSSTLPSILFVDDNPEVRLLLEQMLEGTYDLVLASDAEEALGILGDEEFDLFLLDIKLGEGRSGTELLHLLRDLEPTASVPAVALTTYGMKGDREALLAEGFDEHVSKPFFRDELTEAIDRVLSNRASSASKS
jgi:Response regulator containing CheY-like receiver, AAA-type ATPase, and DNA-binding domains